MWTRRLVILFAVLAATLPVLRHVVDGTVPGQDAGPVDGIHSIFYYEVFAERLRGHGSVGRIDEMWFPLGRPLLLAQQNIVDALLAAPLLLALGAARGTALFVALTVGSNALAGAWLAGRVTDNTASRLCGALALGFAPYLWDEIEFGRYTQAWLAPTAVAVGLALEATRSGWRVAVAAGLALALAGYHYWFYGLFAAVVVAGVMAGQGLRALPRLLLVAGVSLVAVSPFMLYVATAWQEVPGAGTPPHFAPATRPLGGLPGFDEPGVYLPQLFVLAGLAALLVPGRGPVIGALVAGGWLYALALGEYVRVGDQALATPYHYLVKLPFFDRFWWPQRALGAVTVAAIVPLARLCGAGRLGAGAAGLVALLSAAQAARAPGFPGAWRLPEQTAWHAALPPGPVLFVPLLSPREGMDLFRSWPSHHRPLVNGMSMWTLDLWPVDYRAWFHEQPFLEALYATERGGQATTAPADAAALRDLGVVGIVADWEQVTRAERRVLVSALGDPRCTGRYCYWSIGELP